MPLHFITLSNDMRIILNCEMEFAETRIFIKKIAMYMLHNSYIKNYLCTREK